MNILFALNSGYVHPLCICLRTMMKSNPGIAFDFYIAYSSLTDDDFDEMRQNVDETRCNIIPVKVDNAVFDDAEILKRTSKETYYRLLAMDYLPAEVDRILYIDPDIVIINSLDKLYNIDFGKNLFAGAPHFRHFMNRMNSRRLKLPTIEPYINAGVLMMNISGLRTFCTAADVVKFIGNPPVRLRLADQDVLNKMFYGKIKSIDPLRYNLDDKTYIKNAARISKEWVDKNTVIVHYNGSKKPWKDNYKGYLGDYYYENCD